MLQPSSLIIADRDRAEQFKLLGSVRYPFRQSQDWVDADGIAWCGVRVGNHWFGATWLGPGWVFDPAGRQRRHDDISLRQQAMATADKHQHEIELRNAVDQVCWGEHASRILWAVYATVLRSKEAVNKIADTSLAQFVWGNKGVRPRHWRSTLMKVLNGLTWLHVTEAGEDKAKQPVFNADTALITHVADLRNNPAADVCDDHCGERHGPRHHHFLINVGRGLLGSLEKMAAHEDDGHRHFDFRYDKKKAKKGSTTLRGLGKNNRLTSVYIPALIGEPTGCQRFSNRQHLIIQVLVREVTRLTKKSKDEVTRPEAVVDACVPAFARLDKIHCPLLDAAAAYVSFNGNKRRKGQGHKLSTWAIRCGYEQDQVGDFIRDVACISPLLNLTVVGIERDNKWLDLDQLVEAAGAGTFKRLADRVHLRFYAPLDYHDRWNRIFGWPLRQEHCPAESVDAVGTIIQAMHRCRLTQRSFADAIGIDPSFLNKVLRGKKPASAGLLSKVEELLKQFSAMEVTAGNGPVEHIERGATTADIALAYRQDYGWSVIPQIRGQKKPPVQWKPYQHEYPTAGEMQKWWRIWPDAGIALITGALSNVFVIDVDGPEAHEALLKHLGDEPLAPKVFSGSGSVHRFHLFFRHPSIATKAKATPWHPKLEFRGEASLVVLPPSIHKSGNPYRWDRPIGAGGLPELPERIVAAMTVRPATAPQQPTPVTTSLAVEVSSSTATFLRGQYAEGPGWNERLFRAACDLHARGVTLDQAEPALLAGARPWSEAESETARRTIASAFSEPRTASQY